MNTQVTKKQQADKATQIWNALKPEDQSHYFVRVTEEKMAKALKHRFNQFGGEKVIREREGAKDEFGFNLAHIRIAWWRGTLVLINLNKEAKYQKSKIKAATAAEEAADALCDEFGI